MIKNYFKTIFRIMLRQKGYTAINIIGLSVGIAASLIIIIYIVDELSYDKMHSDARITYRVNFSGRLQGDDFNSATSPAPIAEALQQIPEVKEAVRFGLWDTMPLSVGEKAFTVKRMLIADSNFFKFFSFPVIKGNPETFLKGPNKMVITASVAKRYFGDDDPIGQIMLRGAEKTAAEVTGVVQDPPHNSHIAFDIILSGESWEYMKNMQWTSNNLYTYFKINPGAEIQLIKSKLDQLVEKNAGAELERIIGLTFKQFREAGNNLGLHLMPMLDIRLNSNLAQEITPNGSKQYLYIFGVIALFIIMIACINFMNLSTARSAIRAKEVGVRKTIGANRNGLIFQFLSESILYSILSVIIALAIIGIMLDSFNLLSGKQLQLSFFADPVVVISLIIFALVIGLLAGTYPAFYLTAFKPTEVLKGKIRSGFKNSTLRNVMVVWQFTISIALIFGSLVVYRQLGYMQEKNLGFEKENIVNLLHALSLGKNAQAFKNEVTANPSFKGVSFANQLPPNLSWNNAFRKGASDQDFLMYNYQVDYDHVNTMGYELAEGRFFSRDFKSDTAAIVLNEAAYKAMNFTSLEEATVLSYQGPAPTPLKVIGVLKDFNYQSLRDQVRPVAILLGREPNYELAIRLAPGNTQEQIKTLEQIYKRYADGAPFEYTFVDQNFDGLFRAEQRMSQIILIFTILAIGIACLGLFGLSAYMAEQRAKEISIRKVMGASALHLTFLMSKSFIFIVLIAFVIATPMAWYFSENWLSGFANRMQIDLGIVVISGVASLLVAILTVLYQSIKAARENPVDAMRAE